MTVLYFITFSDWTFHPLFSVSRKAAPIPSDLQFWSFCRFLTILSINPLNAELNPICHFLALLGAHHILHASRIRVSNTRAPFSGLKTARWSTYPVTISTRMYQQRQLHRENIRVTQKMLLCEWWLNQITGRLSIITTNT